MARAGGARRLKPDSPALAVVPPALRRRASTRRDRRALLDVARAASRSSPSAISTSSRSAAASPSFFVEDGTLRFAINLDAAQRAGLRLSSKLLSLAKIVKDDRDAIRR